MMNDGQGQSETAELVRASRAGDKTAFDRLVQLHQRQAMGLALGILANVDDAAEAVQEAFVKGYVGKISIPMDGGRYVIEFMLRESDLTDELRKLRQEKIKEILAGVSKAGQATK